MATKRILGFLQSASPKSDYKKNRELGKNTVYMTSGKYDSTLSQQDLQYWLEAEDLSDALYREFKGDEASKDIYTDKEINIKLAQFSSASSIPNIINYKVKKVNVSDQGINAFVLIPQNTPLNETPEVKVIFTGTKDKDGLYRNVETDAAGDKSYEDNKETIYKAIDDAVSKVDENTYGINKNKVKISVIGHSLGAADAQRTALLVAQKRDKDKQSFGGKKIDLNLVSNCSPKVTKTQADDFAKALYNTNKTLNFGSLACKYSSDIVPKFGETDIRMGTYTHPGEASKDVFDLAGNGIKLLYGKAKVPFLHESAAYDKKQSSFLYKIQVYKYSPSEQTDNLEDRKNKMKRILNSSFGLSKNKFINLIKEIITELRGNSKLPSFGGDLNSQDKGYIADSENSDSDKGEEDIEKHSFYCEFKSPLTP